MKISTIFLKEYGNLVLTSEFGNRNVTQFIIVEDYPIQFDDRYLYETKKAIYSDGTQTPHYEKIEKDGFEICELEGQYLFFI